MLLLLYRSHALLSIIDWQPYCDVSVCLQGQNVVMEQIRNSLNESSSTDQRLSVEHTAGMSKGRLINKLQNSAILLLFRTLKNPKCPFSMEFNSEYLMGVLLWRRHFDVIYER